MNKSAIRKEFVEIRKNIKDKNKKSLKICTKLLQREDVKTANNIALYYPMEDEVNIVPLINELIKSGLNIYLPKIENKSLKFYLFTSYDELRDNPKYYVFDDTFFEFLVEANNAYEIAIKNHVDNIN